MELFYFDEIQGLSFDINVPLGKQRNSFGERQSQKKYSTKLNELKAIEKKQLHFALNLSRDNWNFCRQEMNRLE